MLDYRINKSKEIILNLLSLCSDPALSVSFGKDSLVMYDIVKDIFPGIKCFFLKSSETYMMYNYEEIIAHYVNAGMNLTIIETQRLEENNWNWEIARKKGNKDFDLLDELPHDAVFLGLRIQESKQRKISLIRKENRIYPFIHEYKNGLRKNKYRACPVAVWDKEEILFYLKYHKLPFLDAYNLGADIRTTARLTGDAVRNGSLTTIKMINPERYNKLVAKIPQLKSKI